MSRRLSGINSHATPVLVCRPGHESWENSHMQTLASQLSISSTLMQLLFSFDRGMRVEKTLMQTLASHLSCIVNFHATLVLVWPGHESWESLIQTLACHAQVSPSSVWGFLYVVTKRRLCFRLQETELSKPGHLLKKLPFQQNTGVAILQVYFALKLYGTCIQARAAKI
jgi:hypothetical protein